MGTRRYCRWRGNLDRLFFWGRGWAQKKEAVGPPFDGLNFFGWDRLRATEVAAVFGFDADALASDDEEGDLNGEAGFDGDRFVNVVGRVAFDAVWGIGDEHGDGSGEFHGSDGAVGEDDVVFLTFDEVLLHGDDDVVADEDVFEGFGVEEVVAVAVDVAELMGFTLEVDAVERLVGGEAEVVDPAGGEALDGHLHIGSHARRRLVLHVGDDADVVVVPYGLTAAEIDNGGGSHGRVVFRQFEVNCKRVNRDNETG